MYTKLKEYTNHGVAIVLITIICVATGCIVIPYIPDKIIYITSLIIGWTTFIILLLVINEIIKNIKNRCFALGFVLTKQEKTGALIAFTSLAYMYLTHLLGFEDKHPYVSYILFDFATLLLALNYYKITRRIL